MLTPGALFRRERQARGVTLTEIAESTKINKRYLEAIEEDDFRWLPGGVYNRSFVRAYAEFIGADPQAWVEAYAREETAQGREDEATEIRCLPRRNRRRRWIVLGAAIAIVVAALTLLALRSFRSVGPDPQATGASPSGPFRERSTEGSLSHDVSSTDKEPPADERARVPAQQLERLSVPDFGVGTGVVDHELQGDGTQFAEGTRVWFWTRVVGGVKGETIRHVWIREGQRVASIPMTLGGPHWRTHSYKTMRRGSAGDWAVELHDENGLVAARTEFVCVSPDHP